MDSSPGAATIISLVVAIVLLAVPATAALPLPSDWTVAADLVAGGPGPSSNGTSSSARTIDESYNGQTVHVARGDILRVQLLERDRDRTWHFDGSGSFTIIGDAIPETYPMRHDFRVRVQGPGELRFTKIDRRDGFVIDRFSVRVVIDKSKSDDDSSTPFPIWEPVSFGLQMSAFPFRQQI